MGMRIRKSIKIAPGVKANFGLSGMSVSIGTKGMHHTVSTTGRVTDSIHVAPGVSCIKTHGGSGLVHRSNSNEPQKEGTEQMPTVREHKDGHCKSCGKFILIRDQYNPDLCKNCRAQYDQALVNLKINITNSIKEIQSGKHKRDSSMLYELNMQNEWKNQALKIRKEYNVMLDPIFKQVYTMTNQLFIDMVNKGITAARDKCEIDHNNREMIKQLKEKYKKFADWRLEYPNLEEYIDPAMEYMKKKLEKEENK